MNFGFLQGRARTLLAGMAALVVSAGLASSAWAQVMGLQYKFIQGVDDLTVPGGIHDLSGNGHHGTVIDSAYAEFTTGPSGNMNAIHIDNFNYQDETDGSGINTNTLTNHPDLNFFNGPYTAMAWVNLDDQMRDHMVFGTPQPNAPGATSPAAGSLHLGFRNHQIYNGWWGAGTGRDSGYDNLSSGQVRGYVGQPGEWHHVAWRFTGSGGPGFQDMFQDGVLYQSFLTNNFYGGLLTSDGNVPNVPVNLLVGRNVGDTGTPGAFSGSLSDVRVYNVALDDATIATIASLPP
jgi:hypothetical protein